MRGLIQEFGFLTGLYCNGLLHHICLTAKGLTSRATSVFRQMEDDLYFQENGRRPQFFRQMEDNLNFLGKWKTIAISQANGR